MKTIKIKVGASFNGKISTGPYENMSPGFYCDIEHEIPETANVGDIIQDLQKKLHLKCYENFKEVEQTALVDRIKKERESFRFIKQPNGRLVPSVTSIINFDADFHISDDELRQYASQGDIVHKQISEYFATGKWKEAKELNNCIVDLLILKRGSLKLEPIEYNFEAFLKKYPMKVVEYDKQVHNEKHGYSGSLDWHATTEVKVGKDIIEIPIICDAKRTVFKTKVMMQLAAYAKCEGLPEFKEAWAIPTNTNTAQGFSKPLICNQVDIDKYFQLFLEKRAQFEKRYGI